MLLKTRFSLGPGKPYLPYIGSVDLREIAGAYHRRAFTSLPRRSRRTGNACRLGSRDLRASRGRAFGNLAARHVQHGAGAYQNHTGSPRLGDTQGGRGPPFSVASIGVRWPERHRRPSHRTVRYPRGGRFAAGIMDVLSPCYPTCPVLQLM